MTAEEASTLYTAALAASQHHANIVVVQGIRQTSALRREAIREIERIESTGPVDLAFLILLDGILQRLMGQLSREIGTVVENGVRSVVTETFDQFEVVTTEALGDNGLPVEDARRRLGDAEQAALAATLLREVPEAPMALVKRRIRDILGRLRSWVAVAGNTFGSRRDILDAVTQTLKGLPVAEEIRTLARRLFRGDTLPVALDRIVLAETWAGLLLSERLAATASGLIRLGRWQLSSWHPTPDICDTLANYDSGYGPGWYPIQSFPALPHPRCACIMGAVQVRPASQWLG